MPSIATAPTGGPESTGGNGGANLIATAERPEYLTSVYLPNPN